jgi:dTDP-4-amino-4,6-dideoxygalactose transaminase
MTTLETVPFADLGQLHAGLEPRFAAVWADVCRTSSFIGGPYVDAFEAEWAAYVGTDHAVGLANGTDAIALALTALGIGPGDEVLVPANTFIATAEAVAMAGATPRFVDVDPASLLVTPENCAPALTPRTAAVIVVHLYGHVADMTAMTAFARQHGLALIEDAAQAHGATWEGRAVGTFGAAGTFSFYPGKNLGAFGDAGAVVTNDAAVAATIRSLSNHGRSDEDRYVHPHRGVNSRLDSVQAGVLSIKLSMLDAWTDSRRQVAAGYREALADLDLGRPEPGPESGSVWHLYVVRVAERERVRALLARSGVETGIHYPVPCHRQAAFAHLPVEDLPAAEAAAATVLSLPFHPGLTRGSVERVADVLRDALDSHGD